MNDATASAQLEAVEDQYDSVTDMYRMLTRLCVDKCTKPAPEETFVKVKEGLCLDRCVAKFFATNELISETMKKMQERQQAQMEASQQVQTGGIKSMFGL